MSSHSSTKTCYQTSPCTPCTRHDMFSSSDSPMAVSSHDPKLRALSPIQLDHASLLSRTSAGPSRYLGWHRLIDLLYHRHIIVEDSCNNEKFRYHPHYHHQQQHLHIKPQLTFFSYRQDPQILESHSVPPIWSVLSRLHLSVNIHDDSRPKSFDSQSWKKGIWIWWHHWMWNSLQKFVKSHGMMPIGMVSVLFKNFH